MTEQTIIVGGGLIGVATLYELVSRGEPAMLIEASEALGEGASFANGGMITPSMPEPWNSPGVGRHLAASLFDPGAAMKLRLHAVPGLVHWGISFLRHSRPAAHACATEQAFLLARHSAEILHRRIAELQIEVESSGEASMKVFESSQEFEASKRIAERLAPLGLRFDVLDRAGMVGREPELASAAERFVGGLYYPDDATGDARRFLLALADAATTRGGEIRIGQKVRRVRTDAGKVTGVETPTEFVPGTRIVIACGYAAPDLTRPLGLRLPIEPAKGYSVTIEAKGWNARPRVTVVDDAKHTAVSVIGDRLRIVGTAEFAGADLSIRPERIDNLRRLFARLYPHLERNLELSAQTPWAGLRPMSADGLPFIGPAGPGGLWINAGHGQLGWTMAAGSAELLVDQMLGEAAKLDPAPYMPARLYAAPGKG